MVAAGKEILGTVLGIIGFLGAIIICGLPTWKVTAFIGSNIVTAQVIWEGLWMNCVTQSTGQMQCKVYDSLLALPQDLQAARALVVIAIIAALFGILLGVAGGRCTNCIDDEDFYNPTLIDAQKRELGASLYIGWGTAALLFIGGGLLCSICPPKEKNYNYDAKYSKAQSVESKAYV
uniref:Claudin n=1 Tax=Nothobranchius furzeri TaxID=105023 RepID=A0A8C6L2S0_NOTFU